MTQIIQFSTLGGPEVLEHVDHIPSPPGEGEVQIAMQAAGLNRAELLFFAGAYLIQPQLPSALGFEGAGKIVAAGPGVDNFAVGDRVAILPVFKQDEYGVLGQVVNVPANALERLPDEVSYRDAAAFWMAFGTAYGLLVQQGGLKEGAGQHVVLNAASSSVGVAAFQIVKAHGGTSIALTRGADKADALKEAGADHVIVTSEEDVTARILEITGGQGFDIACDAVSGPEADAIANAAGFEATFVIYGLLSGDVGPTPLNALIGRGMTVKGFHLAWLMMNHADRRKAAVTHLSTGLANGAYTPTIDKVFGFSEVGEAYSYMASNAQLGKILIDIDQ